MATNTHPIKNNYRIEGELTVNNNIVVTGNVDGRDISTDGNNQDNHIANTNNPHSVTKTQIGLNNIENLKVNLSASSSPTTNDDSGNGYSIGSRWIDTTGNKEYVCVDNTLTSAIWTETTQISLLTTKGDILTHTGSIKSILSLGLDNQVLVADSTQSTGIKWATNSVSSSTDVWIISDEQSVGTNGGKFTKKTWQTRTLNTIRGSSNTDVTLLSNKITINAGTYYVHGTTPGYKVKEHQCRLYNITDINTEIIGTSEYADTKGKIQSISTINGHITLSGATEFRLEHICDRSQSPDGFGRAGGFSTEVYSTVVISKI